MSHQVTTTIHRPACIMTHLVRCVQDNFGHHFVRSPGFWSFYLVSYQQYYYDCETQQYLYWDSETQTYAPAPSEPVLNAESNANGPAGSSTTAAKEPKEKKQKFKNKSAQQVDSHSRGHSHGLNCCVKLCVCLCCFVDCKGHGALGEKLK